MSRRTRNIALTAAAVIVALLVGIYAGVLNTGPGRRAVLDALAPTLNEAVGGEVHIGGTAGHWPHRIVLRDVTVADHKGVWLDIPQLTVRWNPLTLISGRISVREITLPEGTLSRLPRAEKDEAEPPGLPRLPRLPDLAVRSITVGKLELGPQVAGDESALRLTGSADMRADMLQVSLHAATEPAVTDKADIEIDWRPAENHLKAEVSITGSEGGLFTQLSGLEKGPLALSIRGTGPASEWAGAVKGKLGSYGDVFGNLTCACSGKPDLKLAIDAVPGPALSREVRRYLGENPSLEARLFSPKTSAWAIEVTSLKAPAVKVLKPVRMVFTEGWRLLRFDISGNLEAGPPLREAVPEWVGRQFEISARGALGGGGSMRVAAASVSSSQFRLDVKDARRTATGKLGGEIDLRLLTSDAAPGVLNDLAGESADLSFSLAGDADRTIRLQNVSLKTKRGTSAGGSVAYTPDTRVADAEIDLNLPPPVFAVLTGLPEPGKEVTGKVSVKGPLSELSASLQARTPELALDPRPLPPAETTLAVTGGMDDPRGKLTVRRRDDPKAPPLLSADIAWPGRDVLHVTGLQAEIDGARLEGEAHVETRTGGLTGKATLNVPELSALAADAAGSLSADLSLERKAKDGLVLTASASSPQLRYGEYGVNELKIDASGPISTLKLTAKADAVTLPDGRPVRDFATAGNVNLTDGTEVTLNKFAAILEGTAISLSEPARITVRDGKTQIPSARFNWGESGRVTASATLSPEVLTASLDMMKAPVPGQSVLASGSVKVDTQAERPGTIDLRLDPRDGGQVLLKIAGTWNGRTLNVSGILEGYGEQAALGRNEILTASIPLTMSRTADGLGLGTEGSLDAALNYRGRVSALTGIFLTEKESHLDGDFEADIRVTGTLAAPVAKGSASLSKGRYENVEQGIVLSAIDARLDFTGGIEAASGNLKLTAWDGQKPGRGRPPVTGEGRIRLEPDGLRVDADLQLTKAQLIDRGDLDATLSGNLTLAGTLPRLALTGDLRIDKLDLLIPENQPKGVVDVPVVLVDEEGRPLDEKEQAASGEGDDALELALNVNVRSDGQAFVRGRGLDTEWTAKLSVGGTIDAIELDGQLSLKKGSLSFAGRKFDLTRGEVSFTGETPPDPVLDVVAEHETEEDVRALVKVSGRTSDPEISLDSTPPLPREDIMALVLFGKPATELTALQALQVSQSVAQLTGIGPFGGGSIMDRARRTLGLDLLDLTFGGEDGDIGLKVGSYVSEGVFVSASQDVTGEGGKVSVEVEVTDEFSVKTDVGQDASGNVSAQWKKDY